MGYAVIAERECIPGKSQFYKDIGARIRKFRKELKESKQDFMELHIAPGTPWRSDPSSSGDRWGGIDASQGHRIFTWGPDL